MINKLVVKRYEYQVRFQMATMTTSKLRLTVASLEDHVSPGSFAIKLKKS